MAGHPVSWRHGVLRVVLLCAFAVPCVKASALELSEWVIGREEWPTFTNSANIGSLPQVREALEQFDETSRSRLVVRYPGGKVNALWADELIHWFVAHGIPRSYISRKLGTGDPGILLLVLESGD